MQLSLGPRPVLVDNLDVVVEDGGDDGDHVGLDDTGPDVLGAPYTNVKDALEGEVPLPHVHHVLAPALLEDAYQTLDAAIDGEDVPDAGRRRGQIGEMVERVDEREGRGAVEGTAVVEGGGDADRGLVGIGDAKVDFTHVGWLLQRAVRGGCEGEEPWGGAALVSHVVGDKQAW